jgi:diguanylate cyclase (GGDEF)-like protein/PAS domain S-box-containing protein
MTLRNKALAITGSALCMLLVCIYALSQIIVADAFAQYERAEVSRNMLRLAGVVSDEVAGLESTAKDWANWDDTYRFVQDHNPYYAASNLSPAGTYVNNRLNLLMLLDAWGQVVAGRAYNLQEGMEVPVPASIYAHLRSGSPLLRHSEEHGVSGLLNLPEGLLLVSAEPVLTSEGAGPPAGTLIFGRFLNEQEVARLSHTSQLAFSVHAPGDPQLPMGLASQLAASADPDPVTVRPAGEEVINGYLLLRDIYGRPAAILRAQLPRTIYLGGKTTALYFVVALVVTGLVFITVTILTLKRLVVNRLARLNAEVSRVAAGNDPGARVSACGDDELGNLARQINNMLEALEQSRRSQIASEQRYRRLFERSLVGVYRTSENGRILDCNEALVRILGCSSREEVLALSAFDLYARPADRLSILRAVHAQGNVTNTELLLRRRDGSPVWVLDNMNMVEHDEEHGAVYEGTLIDITDRKLAEMALAESERKYRHLIEQASDGIAILNTRGDIVEANSRACEALGYAQGELTGTNIRDLMLTPTGQEARRSFAQLLAGRVLMVEAMLRRKDGSAFPVEISARRLSDGRIQAIARDITERKLLEQRLAYQAYHDPLTGLPNRAMLMERLERAFRGRTGTSANTSGSASRNTHRAGGEVALLFLDLDDFKVVNDSLGHKLGDQLLVEVASRLRQCVRNTDMVARLGGDEFTLLLEGIEDAGRAKHMARRILNCLQAPMHLDGHRIKVRASVGIALSNQLGGNDTPDDLLRNADMAMYAAKGQGKSRYMVFKPCMEAHIRRQFQTGIRLQLANTDGTLPDPSTNMAMAIDPDMDTNPALAINTNMDTNTGTRPITDVEQDPACALDPAVAR